MREREGERSEGEREGGREREGEKQFQGVNATLCV